MCAASAWFNQDKEKPIKEETSALYPLLSAPLTLMTAKLGQPYKLGYTPAGDRKVVPVIGGVVEGERLSGKVLPGGSDWAVINAAGILELDVRLVIQTDDGALINCFYKGIRHAPSDVTQRLSAGKKVDYDDMYFRIAPRFDTADPRYTWLNGILTIGIGERLPEGPRYHIHEIR